MNKEKSSDFLPYDEWLRRVSEWLVHYTTLPIEKWRVKNLSVWHRQGLEPQEAAQQLVRIG